MVNRNGYIFFSLHAYFTTEFLEYCWVCDNEINIFVKKKRFLYVEEKSIFYLKVRFYIHSLLKNKNTFISITDMNEIGELNVWMFYFRDEYLQLRRSLILLEVIILTQLYQHLIPHLREMKLILVFYHKNW